MTFATPAITAGNQAHRSEIEQSDLSDRIYQVIKTEILTGQLAPGQRLSLDEVAQSFSVSVTPLRDALRLLAAEGLVELRQRRGAYVTQLSAKIIREVFQIREMLECAAVEYVIGKGPAVLDQLQQILHDIDGTIIGDSHQDYLAYIRLDQRFHQCLIDSADNQKLSQTYANLGSFTLVSLVLYSAHSQRAVSTRHEHQRILDALRMGDAPAARAALTAHLHSATADLQHRMTIFESQADDTRDPLVLT